MEQFQPSSWFFANYESVFGQFISLGVKLISQFMSDMLPFVIDSRPAPLCGLPA